MTSPYAGRSFVCDIETNGLLREVTRVHCAVAIDIDTDEVLDFKPNQIGEFLDLYQNAKLIIGHNFIGYDAAVIEKLYGIPVRPASAFIDTMNLARLVFPDVKNSDMVLASKWKKWKFKRDKWEQDERYKLQDMLTAAYAKEHGLHLDEVPPEVLVAHREQAAAHDLGEARQLSQKPLEFPGYMCGFHTLEAWGYRMGTERKGEYTAWCKEQGIDPWAEWRPEMHTYMLQDGKLNLQLYRYLMGFNPAPQAIALEMRVQHLCSKIERNGWPFNVKAGEALYMTLCAERDQLNTSLRTLFPPWEVQLEDFIPKRNNKTKGYIAGVPVKRSEIVEFNPGSREHIADRLRAKYGWRPKDYTAGGKPKIDDEILQELPYEEAKALARFFVIQKRIGQLAEGPGAWLKKVDNDGFIRCRYNTNGAVSGRATHSDINVAQVPSLVNADGPVPFGQECRELFTVLKGFKQLGADQAGLELRAFGSFLAHYDDGKYMEVVLNGDVHWENAKALMGWPEDILRDKHNPEHEDARSVAKRFIYALLYGSGDELLGALAGVTDAEVQAWRDCPDHMEAIRKLKLAMIQKAMVRHMVTVLGKPRQEAYEALREWDDKTKERMAAQWGIRPPTKKQLRLAYKGLLLREAFYLKFPALPKLIAAVKKAAKKGYIKGIDGRTMPVRSAHSALNLLLQGAGAIICKQWIVDVEDALQAAGLKHGWDGDYAILGWIHDELQIAVRDGLEDQVSEIVIAQARRAGDPFPSWRCPTDGDTKVGRHWADCH